MTLLPDPSTLLLQFRKPVANGVEPLRVAVVLDYYSAWTKALVSFLKQLPGMEICPILLGRRAAAVATRPSWLTDRLYSASRAKFDPFGEIAAEEPTVSLDEIRTAGCGILIWLSSQHPDIDLSSLAKHGAFSVRFGKRNSRIPFWDEVSNSDATSTATVYWHQASLVRGRAIRIAETSTWHGLHLTLNAEEPLAAVIRTLANLCLDLRDAGSEFDDQLGRFPEESIDAALTDYPSSFAAGRFAVTKLARSAFRRWKARGKAGKWFVAMRPNTGSSGSSIIDPDRLDLTGFQDVDFTGGIEAADPFVWEHEGRQYLLIEEIMAGSNKGRLGCVEVMENGSCSELRIILEQPYHLSYPCVVPADGELFLLPETSDVSRVELYRFTRFPWEVERVAALAEGLAVVDTTPIFLNDRWYFFTTTLQPFMETFLFWSERLDGEWKLHPRSPVSCSVRNSRSAGHLFWKNGRLYRPTQDCSECYGYAMQVNEVVRLTPDEYEERKVNWISPAWRPGLLATHTWNESSRLQVIDGLRQQAIPKG